ncbi:MAG: hypothetical protein M3R11_08640 [Acidobacteriota bacterium]|nr:hypothetical protein [Acidobacteriota bacterium]
MPLVRMASISSLFHKVLLPRMGNSMFAEVILSGVPTSWAIPAVISPMAVFWNSRQNRKFSPPPDSRKRYYRPYQSSKRHRANRAKYQSAGCRRFVIALR